METHEVSKQIRKQPITKVSGKPINLVKKIMDNARMEMKQIATKM